MESSENWQFCSSILPHCFSSNTSGNRETSTLHNLNLISYKRIQNVKKLQRKRKKTPYKSCNRDFRNIRKKFLENVLSERCWHFLLPKLYISISIEDSIPSPIIFKKLFLCALVEVDKKQVKSISNIIKLHVKYFPASQEKMKTFYETFILYNDTTSREFRSVGNLIQRLTCNSEIEQEVKILSGSFFLGRVDVCHDQQKIRRGDEIPVRNCNNFLFGIDDEKVLESEEILYRFLDFIELYLTVFESELGKNRFSDLQLFPLAMWGKGSKILLTDDCKAIMKLFSHGPDCYRNFLNRLLSLMAEVVKASVVLMRKDYLSSELINVFVSTLSVYINESGNHVNLVRCISLSWLQFSVALYLMLEKNWLKTKISLSSSRTAILEVLLKIFLDCVKKQEQGTIKAITSRTVKPVYLLKKTGSRNNNKLRTRSMESLKKSGSLHENYESTKKVEFVSLCLLAFLKLCLIENEKLYVPPKLLEIISTIDISGKNTNYSSFFTENIVNLLKFISLN